MSQITIALFKKILATIIIATVLLQFLSLFFTFISTAISVVPVFYMHYMKLGIGVIVFKIIKGWLVDE